MTAYQRVLVGIDGSKQSAMAFAKGMAVAKRSHARLYLLSVVNGPAKDQQTRSSFGFIDRAGYKKVSADLAALLAKKEQEARAAGVDDVVSKVLSGNAKIELTTGFVSQEKVNLVILGASGLNMVGRVIVGSTTAYVVREAPCDVMVVKTDKSNHRLTIEKSPYHKM